MTDRNDKQAFEKYFRNACKKLGLSPAYVEIHFKNIKGRLAQISEKDSNDGYVIDVKKDLPDCKYEEVACHEAVHMATIRYTHMAEEIIKKQRELIDELLEEREELMTDRIANALRDL